METSSLIPSEIGLQTHSQYLKNSDQQYKFSKESSLETQYNQFISSWVIIFQSYLKCWKLNHQQRIVLSTMSNAQFLKIHSQEMLEMDTIIKQALANINNLYLLQKYKKPSAQKTQSQKKEMQIHSVSFKKKSISLVNSGRKRKYSLFKNAKNLQFQESYSLEKSKSKELPSQMSHYDFIKTQQRTVLNQKSKYERSKNVKKNTINNEDHDVKIQQKQRQSDIDKCNQKIDHLECRINTKLDFLIQEIQKTRELQKKQNTITHQKESNNKKYQINSNQLKERSVISTVYLKQKTNQMRNSTAILNKQNVKTCENKNQKCVNSRIGNKINFTNKKITKNEVIQEDQTIACIQIQKKENASKQQNKIELHQFSQQPLQNQVNQTGQKFMLYEHNLTQFIKVSKKISLPITQRLTTIFYSQYLKVCRTNSFTNIFQKQINEESCTNEELMANKKAFLVQTCQKSLKLLKLNCKEEKKNKIKLYVMKMVNCLRSINNQDIIKNKQYRECNQQQISQELIKAIEQLK